jgi:membrane-associated phospholipid phosphatase
VWAMEHFWQLDQPILAVSRSKPFDIGLWPILVVMVGCLVIRFFMPPSLHQPLVSELLLVLPAVLFYFVIRGQVDARASDAIHNAQQIIDLERQLDIFIEPELQQRLLRSETLETVMNWIYIWLHWPVVTATIIWLVVCRPPRVFAVYRNAFLISGAVGMIIFALHPVAPPRLMPGLLFDDTILDHSRSYRVLQPPALTNPFAAMPSLHVGWNLLVGIAIVREARNLPLRIFGVIMPALMFSATVLTANHYILDGIAGGALATICLLLATRITINPNRWLTWHGLTKRSPG